MAAIIESTPCSKCGEALDTEGTPKWCRACRAKYRREYEDTKETRAEARGYARGVEAMREHLANRFAESIGSAGCTGYEAAGYIEAEPAPKLVD